VGEGGTKIANQEKETKKIQDFSDCQTATKQKELPSKENRCKKRRENGKDQLRSTVLKGIRKEILSQEIERSGKDELPEKGSYPVEDDRSESAKAILKTNRKKRTYPEREGGVMHHKKGREDRLQPAKPESQNGNSPGPNSVE